MCKSNLVIEIDLEFWNLKGCCCVWMRTSRNVS